MPELTDHQQPTDAQERGASGRRRVVLAIVLAVVGVTAFVLFWFQPHKLFIDERVVEPLPTAAASPTTAPARAAPATSEAAPPTSGAATQPSSTPSTTAVPVTTVDPAPTGPPAVEPVTVATGDFVSRDHGTSGTARVLQLADGQVVVRLEALDTSNGPDLFVYLTTTPAEGEEGTFDDDYVSLGRLKGNQGDQNYDVPAGTPVGRYPTVVIWCDRFDSAFGAADLRPL